MNVFYNCICIYHDFDATVGRKLGDNIVTVTNNVLHTFLKIFAVVKFVPGFPIIADTGKLIKNFRITKGTFLHEFCLGASTFSYTLTWACVLDCSTLRYLIKIFKMAAELCNRVGETGYGCHTFYITDVFRNIVILTDTRLLLCLNIISCAHINMQFFIFTS